MATITATGKWLSKGVHKTTWANLADADDGTAQSLANLPDKSVQVDGTFDSATVLIEGSNNDGVDWYTLNDPQGNPLTFATARQEQILENPELIRASTSGGLGSAALTVELISTRSA